MATSETVKVASNTREHKILLVLDDQSVDETTSSTVDARNYTDISMIVESGTGVSTGVVTLEAAASSAYAGTWKSLGTATTNAASTAFTVALTSNSYPYIRARISTVIGGGTVDVYLILK